MKIAQIMHYFAALLTLLLIPSKPLFAQQVLEHGAEHRLQFSWHVNDGALAKFLPYEWTVNSAADGAAKDVNLRLVLVERIAVTDRFNRPIGKSTSHQIYLAIPVSGPAGANGQMILAGLTSSQVEADGNFKGFKLADTVKVSQSMTSEDGRQKREEHWTMAATSSESIEVHLKFETQFNPKSPATELRMFDPKSPTSYQSHRIEQVVDSIRNASLNIDRVSDVSIKITGNAYQSLFDGNEKLLAIDFIPWASHIISAP